MDVYFRDDNLEVLAIVDDYIQMMWEEKLRGEGSLTIELPNTAKYRALAKQARLITIKESKRCMIIDNVKYQITGEYAHIIVNGVPVEKFFQYRWCQAKSMAFWWKVAVCVDTYRRFGGEEFDRIMFRDVNSQHYRDLVRDDYRINEDAYSILIYGISKRWYNNNKSSMDTFRKETTSYKNDYAMFVLKVFLTGLFDSKLAIPGLKINPRIILPDGRDYNNEYAAPNNLTNRTAFDAYTYVDTPKDWTLGKALNSKEQKSQSTTDQSGMTAWDLIVAGSQNDHFEVRFDEASSSLTLNHVATASLDTYAKGYLAKIELSPLLENIDSAEYTEYRFKEPSVIYGYMNIDDPYDGHFLFEGSYGVRENSGYNRIELGTKVEAPNREPGQYYGHAIMYGKNWTAPDGTEHPDRDLVLRRYGTKDSPNPRESYCIRRKVVDSNGAATENYETVFVAGSGGGLHIGVHPNTIVRSAYEAGVGSNREGTVSAVPNFGYIYNRDYYLGDCVRVTFATGDEPVVKDLKVSGYNWNVTNGSVVHHPIFEAL